MTYMPGSGRSWNYILCGKRKTPLDSIFGVTMKVENPTCHGESWRAIASVKCQGVYITEGLGGQLPGSKKFQEGGRVPGLGQVLTKKMRGHSRKKLHENREIAGE